MIALLSRTFLIVGFPLPHFKYHSLLACQVPEGKSVDNLTGVPCFYLVVFLLMVLRCSLYSFKFVDILIVMCQCGPLWFPIVWDSLCVCLAPMASPESKQAISGTDSRGEKKGLQTDQFRTIGTGHCRDLQSPSPLIVRNLKETS